MAKRLPIGISDYKKIIEDGYYYVDKTILVKEVVQKGGEVALITRPRRFGKTLNLSMLQYFFEKQLDGQTTSHLFTNTAIWQDEECRALQGQFPVISLTFKEVKEDNWNDAYAKIQTLIANEYQRYQALITAHQSTINPTQFKIFNQIAAEDAKKNHVEGSLKALTKLLHDISNKGVIVLLDEYDTPIQAAYLNGYYQKMVSFIRNLFTSALKDNKFLERSVMTGILRTAKEGIFSGLNNLNVCTLFHDLFADKFGFASHEVDALLKDQEVSHQSDIIKAWYNGYHVGKNALVYNPWSILECAKNQGELQAYWVNTSDNAMIKTILIKSNQEVKDDLEKILNEISVTKEIDEAMIFPGIETNELAIWSLLFFSGYLTYTEKIVFEEAPPQYTLRIPNKEIRLLYRKLLSSILTESFTTISVQSMLNAMITGDVHVFSVSLQEFLLNSMSCYDFSAEEPEKSYHLFVLGLLVILNDRYFVTSNRESGHGRYDIMLMPRDVTKTGPSTELRTGVVLEFKKINHKDETKAPSPDLFEKTCQEALEQIKQKNYIHELRAKGVASNIIYGVAFFKKQLLVKAETIK